jgi:YrbI family 3-deoxy-D-manno-octulosonate 8-phosphate phosphatase
MKIPKLVITDIDGVWTDGGMYYSSSGEEMKKFNTKDSAGVLFLRLLGIPMAIMTGEDIEVVRRRGEKLKIDYVFLGVKDKLQEAMKLCQDLGIEMDEVAFVGDEINDLRLLKRAGFTACPSDASDFVKEIVDVVLDEPGGTGAFRSFVMNLLPKEKQLEAIELYHQQFDFSQ